MRKIAIIGASYLQLPLVKRAKEMGLYTICFAWAEGAVCKDVADKFYPISIVEKEQILDVCRQEQIDGICTIASDTAAPTVAYVAEQMGLIGNSYAHIEQWHLTVLHCHLPIFSFSVQISGSFFPSCLKQIL